MALVGKLETWDFVAIALYFMAVIGVGIYSMLKAKKGTVGGYFLAGRYMIWLPVGASLFASNIGSEHFIGLAGSGAAAGVAVGAFELNASTFLQLLGWVFLPVYIASGVCTLPEYMKKRFGGQRIQVFLAVMSLVLYIFTKISVNLYSGALFIQQAMQWNIYLSIFLLLLITALTAITGGLTAVIYTDTLQMFVMVIGGTILTVMSFWEVGGYTELLHRYMDAIPKPLNSTLLLNATLPDANSTCGIPPPDSWIMLRDPLDSEMPWPGFLLGQTFASLWYWCTDQMMVQRALSAKSLSHARGGTLFAGYLKLLPFFIIVLPGMISRVLYTDEVACADPVSCNTACGNPVGCSNIAYPKLVLDLMPQGLRGIMLSVMLAALMSDLTSIFNSASTLFTMDIYKLIRKRASTRELMIIGRLFVCLLVIIAILWIPVIENMQGAQLFIYIQVISAYLAPPVATVYLLAVLWKRVNEKGAFWSLMIGIGFGGLRMIFDFIYNEPHCGEEDVRPAFMRIHYMYFAFILAVLTGLSMMIISVLTKPPSEKQITRTTFCTRYDKAYEDNDLDATDHEKFAATESLKKAPPDDALSKNGADAMMMDECHSNGMPDDVKTSSDKDLSEGTGNDRTKNTRCTNASRFMLKWFCGAEGEKIIMKESAEMEAHTRKVSSLSQSRNAKIGLSIGLVFLMLCNGFIYMFFTFGSNMFGLIK